MAQGRRLLSAFSLASLALRAAAVPPGYADPKECTPCHARVAETYARTGMARSFGKAYGSDGIADFYQQSSDTHYAMLPRDGKYIQRRWRIGFDGRETDVEEREAAHVIGSGNHAKTWLARAATGKLIELPLGWYAEKGGYWAMNPGYDGQRPPSQRPITYQCMFCHNAYPTPATGEEPVFAEALPEGIDCQRCHGPGARHVQLARHGAKAAEVRASMVNPARLSKERQMEVCMQCHLETTSRKLPSLVRRFGRGPFSYVPGQALGEFVLSFDHAPVAGYDDKFEIAGAAYRLRQSKCFLKSEGRMICTTCHDPHNIPRGAEAERHYSQVCQQCHSVNDRVHVSTAGCARCHMPKRRTEDAAHVVMTDHRIARTASSETRPGRLEASSYQGQVVPYYPPTLAGRADDDLYLAFAQVQHGSNLGRGLERLSFLLARTLRPAPDFLIALGDAWRLAGQPAKAAQAYARNGNPQAMRQEGAARRETGEFTRSAELLEQATRLLPKDAGCWLELGLTRTLQGKAVEAGAALTQAIELDPDMPDAYHALGINQKERGEPAFRRALQLDPYHAATRSSLARLLARQGKREEALYHFAQATRLAPSDAANHYEYALTLVQMNRFDDSEKEASAAVQADPALAEAHELLGGLLSRKQDFEAALHEFAEAVRIKPDFGRAQLDLAAVLAHRGDLDAAASHLRVAAKSSDPQIAQAAERALRQLAK